MPARYLVQDTFPGHMAGPMVLGLLLEGVIAGGETLVIEGSGTPIRVSGFDVHPRQTAAGLEVGLRLHPEDAPKVAAGSMLLSPPPATELEQVRTTG
jgi:selenocysteine-specific translation elongation factor